MSCSPNALCRVSTAFGSRTAVFDRQETHGSARCNFQTAIFPSTAFTSRQETHASIPAQHRVTCRHNTPTNIPPPTLKLHELVTAPTTADSYTTWNAHLPTVPPRQLTLILASPANPPHPRPKRMTRRPPRATRCPAPTLFRSLCICA